MTQKSVALERNYLKLETEEDVEEYMKKSLEDVKTGRVRES